MHHFVVASRGPHPNLISRILFSSYNLTPAKKTLLTLENKDPPLELWIAAHTHTLKRTPPCPSTFFFCNLLTSSYLGPPVGALHYPPTSVPITTTTNQTHPLHSSATPNQRKQSTIDKGRGTQDRAMVRVSSPCFAVLVTISTGHFLPTLSILMQTRYIHLIITPPSSPLTPNLGVTISLFFCHPQNEFCFNDRRKHTGNGAKLPRAQPKKNRQRRRTTSTIHRNNIYIYKYDPLVVIKYIPLPSSIPDPLCVIYTHTHTHIHSWLTPHAIHLFLPWNPLHPSICHSTQNHLLPIEPNDQIKLLPRRMPC